MPNYHNVFARNVRKYTAQKGVSLNALADLAAVSRSQLYSVLAQRSSPSLGWMERISKALDTPLWKMLMP